MDRGEWFDRVAQKILDRLEEFYLEFYPGSRLVRVGNAYRLQPCPMCGHKDCCSIDFAVNCFSSCDWKGTHINAWFAYAKTKGLTSTQALERLEKFTGIPYPETNKELADEYRKKETKNKILKIAEEFYHQQLLNFKGKVRFKEEEMSPLDYLLNVRKRKYETISDFKVGYSFNYLQLHKELSSAGFSKEEIKESKAWIPEGLIIFFYKSPSTGEVVRINTKNPFEERYKTFQNEKEILGDVIAGYSTGAKACLFSPQFSFAKPFVVVEGEQDLMALYENGCTNVCCTGGNISEDSVKIFSKAASKIYLFFDNDKAGTKYVEMLNAAFPDKKLYSIHVPEKTNDGTVIKDPDDYYRIVENPNSWEALVVTAEALFTEDFKITRINYNTWVAENRYKKMEFTIKTKGDKGFVGQANLFDDSGKMLDRDEGVLISKCRQKFRPMNFSLSDAMEKYYEEDLQEKSIEDLVSIYWFSSSKRKIICEVANKIKSEENLDKAVQKLKALFNGSDDEVNNFVDEILKEVNSLSQKDTTKLFSIPRITISEYFNVTNNDAYFYFNYIKQDGQDLKKLPFLLRNDGAMIRLDLIKRKDDQCMLLIDKKYELKREINVSVIETEQCSLTQDWAEKYSAGEITPEEVNPSRLVREIEGYFRRFYYASPQYDCIYKILAMWTYLTYFYELTNKMPYLHISGEKGSGKSLLDSALGLLCFNARVSVHATDAAIFRMLDVDGGTLILDEIENLVSRYKAADSVMGIIIKGGYRKGYPVHRTDMETNSVSPFETYGPKVLSNIFGIEDITGDRFILINTFKYAITKDNRKEEPAFYAKERLHEIRNLTSRCCLSALKHFQVLNDIYMQNTFEYSDARLSEIMTPMLAIAKFADLEEKSKHKGNLDKFVGEYEKTLWYYFENILKVSKEDTADSTPEGIIKKVVKTVAKELAGIIPYSEREYLATSSHRYRGEILHNLEEGWFKLDLLHFKVFIEEGMPGEKVYIKNVSKWLKNIYTFKEADITRKSVTIEDESLIKELNGNYTPKVSVYKFYLRDFLENNFAKPTYVPPVNKEETDDERLF